MQLGISKNISKRKKGECINYEKADKISCCIINSSAAGFRCFYVLFRSDWLAGREWNMGVL